MKDSVGKALSGLKSAGNCLSNETNCFNAGLRDKISTGTCIQSEQKKFYCPRKQVAAYVWAVCRSILPEQLLGTPKSQRTLRKNISKFLGLRRFDKFSLNLSMHKLKASRFHLLSDKHALCSFNGHLKNGMQGEDAELGMSWNIMNGKTHVLRQNILEKWILWLFNSFIVPVIQSNFYVTESGHMKLEVFYYKQSMWNELIKKGRKSFIDPGTKLLNYASVRTAICSRSFGFSTLRFLPKATGVRPLAKLSARSRLLLNGSYQRFMSVNGALRDLHEVLKSIYLNEPEKLGASVFDYYDIYRSLSSFLSTLRSGSGEMPHLFIVIADVSKAFDSVNLDKLLCVMKDIIFSDNFHVKKFQRVVCRKKALFVHDHIHVGCEGTISIESTAASSARLSDCVLVNKVRLVTFDIIFFLKFHS